MKTILIATLLGSVALTGSTLAQTAPSTTAADPATPTERMDAAPGTDAAQPEGMAGDGTASAMQSEGGFFTYQEGDQMLGSGLMGADVWGAEGESIGGVDDLLLDSNGQVMAVVVGVGGFLGIGEKDVAIANDQLEFVLAEETAANTATTMPATGMATTGAATTPAGTTAPVGTAPATTTEGTAAGTSAMGTAGNAMTGTAGAGMASTGMSSYGWGWTGVGIDRIQVNYTREQLETAPAFEYADQ